jgi:hypothetical protein
MLMLSCAAAACSSNAALPPPELAPATASAAVDVGALHADVDLSATVAEPESAPADLGPQPSSRKVTAELRKPAIAVAAPAAKLSLEDTCADHPPPCDPSDPFCLSCGWMACVRDNTWLSAASLTWKAAYEREVELNKTLELDVKAANEGEKRIAKAFEERPRREPEWWERPSFVAPVAIASAAILVGIVHFLIDTIRTALSH